jgi:hypothetical protein
MHSRRKRTRATADKADCGSGLGRWVLEKDLVDRWDGSVPSRVMAAEGRPEVCGREFGWDDDGAVGGERREEGS